MVGFGCPGKVKISRKEIAQLLGKVFIQRSAVNLLSTVLDTPEFFWSAPDSMQALYKKVCEYMELDNRVEVLNNRYGVRTHLVFNPCLSHLPMYFFLPGIFSGFTFGKM
jgi:uncharacterized Rmd1/YagE family protein